MMMPKVKEMQMSNDYRAICLRKAEFCSVSTKQQIRVTVKDLAFIRSLMLSSSAATKAIVGECENDTKVGEN